MNILNGNQASALEATPQAVIASEAKQSPCRKTEIASSQRTLLAMTKCTELISDQYTKRNPQFGSAKGLIKMANDFDAPLYDFEEYMPLW